MCSAHVVVTEYSVNKFNLQVLAPRRDLHGFVTEGSLDKLRATSVRGPFRNRTTICQSHGHTRCSDAVPLVISLEVQALRGLPD